MRQHWRLLAVLLLLLPCVCHAAMQSLSVENDDRPGFLLGSFGYNTGGVLELELKNMELLVQHNFGNKNTYNISLVLQRSLNTGATQTLGNCQLSPTQSDFVFMLDTRARWNDTKIKQTIELPGFYHLYFVNCEDETTVSFQLEWTDYNVDVDGNPVYLSAGDINLPKLFVVFCLCFIVAMFVWIKELYNNRDEVRSIHYLMSGVMLFKIFNLFFEALKFDSIKNTGTPHGWNIPYHIFSFLKGMLLFAAIALIGTGWSIVRPFLTDRDKRIVLVLLAVQLFLNIAAVVVDEESSGSRGWVTWRDILVILDMFCCLIIFIPVMLSIRSLRDSAESDGAAARNLEKLTRFRRFYLLVFIYIYLTRIIVRVLSVSVSFDKTWIGPAFAELSALTFYCGTGYLFRPMPHNPYLLVDDEDAQEPATEVEDGRRRKQVHEALDDDNDIESERVEMEMSMLRRPVSSMEREKEFAVAVGDEQDAVVPKA